MGKKKKDMMRRAARRERAKAKSEGKLPEESILEQEQAADEAVAKAAVAEAAKQSAREKKAPKPVREERSENAWQRITAFLKEVQIEARKINWPAIDETWKSTWVTVIFIVALALFMGVASIGFQRVSEVLFSAGTPAGMVVQPTGTTGGDIDLGGNGGEAIPDPTAPQDPLAGE